MLTELATVVESYFTNDTGESDFLRREMYSPCLVTVPPDGYTDLIYTTKPSSVVRILKYASNQPTYAIIGGSGLPHQGDLQLIQRLVRKCRLLFIGDLDPVDLMIYIWLRECLPSVRTEYWGISDMFLDVLGVVVPEEYMIPFSRAEQEAYPGLKHIFPELTATLGDFCSDIINKAMKIELEAVASAGCPEKK